MEGSEIIVGGTIDPAAPVVAGRIVMPVIDVTGKTNASSGPMSLSDAGSGAIARLATEADR